MAVYVVERDLPGVTREKLVAAQRAAIAAARAMRVQGTPIRYIRSTFVPASNRCLCLFEADSSDSVKALNDMAGIPYRSVMEAYDVAPAK